METATRQRNAYHWTLPDHVERELSRKEFKCVKRCLEAGGTILSCAILHEAQPLQVGYVHRTKNHKEYLQCKKEMAEPRKSRALTIVHR